MFRRLENERAPHHANLRDAALRSLHRFEVLMAKQLLFIPGPVTCAPEVLAAMAWPLIDHRGPEFAGILERASRGMQPLFGTTNDVVVLGCSGTGGLEAAVASSFTPGQRVLAAPVGVFGKRLASIAATYGLEIESIPTPLGHALDPQDLAARLRADAAHEIAGVLLTHNETSTGVQNDMAPLAVAIGDHPATVIVDSVSGLGASAFAMDRWKFDIVVGASQKVLGVPPGLAMAAVSSRAWDRMAQARGARFYLDLLKAREFAKMGQTPWTPPVSLLFALEVGLRRYYAEGPENVYARHDRYSRAIRAFAAAGGIDVFSQPGAHSVTVVAMHAPAGCDVAAVRQELREAHGIVMGGGQAELKGKILRMGTMGDLSSRDVLRALEALETVLRRQGVAIVPGAGMQAARALLEPDLAASR
jgi:aspartate aminotransferase-like enzyme